MTQYITRALLLLFALSILIQPAARAQSVEEDLSVSTQTRGLNLEFPMATLNGAYIGDNVLATVQFGGNAPLVISEKKGLSSDEASEQIVSVSQVTQQVDPSPSILPAEPLVDATPSGVFIQEPTAKFILDIFPTPTPTATPVPTRIATKILTPTTIPTGAQANVTAQATTTVQLSNGGLNADVLFEMSNSYRQSQGLAPFQKDARACELAAARAPEIAAEIANGNMHAGMYGRGLPYWNTENIISMGSEAAAFNWWINDGIHHAAIVGNYTYSCVACQGNNCAQEFTNFQPK